MFRDGLTLSHPDKDVRDYWIAHAQSCRKIADYFGITVEELMGTKKEPAGMGELDKQMQEIVELLFVVSIILCYNSYKLKSRGKRNIE